MSETLGVVVPVYNEERWISGALEALADALGYANLKADVVIVDDGSTDSSPVILDELSGKYGFRVFHRSNQGRFLARKFGLEQLNTDYVLLHDSRVFLQRQSLDFVWNDLKSNEDMSYNGDVVVRTERNAYAGFWAGLTAIGWHRYFRTRKRIRVDIKNFEVFPKGTGCFLAPRNLLKSAYENFTSSYSNLKLVSDDTRLIRYIAGETGYFIDPRFVCEYESRDNFRNWIKQVFYRGTTFVDSYLTYSNPVRRFFFVGTGSLVILGLLGKSHPKHLALVALLADGAAGKVSRYCGASTHDALCVSALLPLFGVAFTGGLLRGSWNLLLAKMCRGENEKTD